jgi:hypothetical protein
VLLKTSQPGGDIIFSLFKKLVEHLGRQATLLVVAGTDEAWDKLPRDISPRMRAREPIRVGSLSLRETEDFINAYTQGASGLSAEALSALQELSGGSPREIVRIAFQEFEASRGNLETATPESLFRSAEMAGSIEDRCKLALSMIAHVFSKTGTVVSNFSIGGQVVADLMVKNETGPFLAVTVIAPTGEHSERKLAQQVEGMKNSIADTWKEKVELLVVAVGYSDNKLVSIISTIAVIIHFDEGTFSGELEALAAKLEQKTRINKDDGGRDKSREQWVAAVEEISQKLSVREEQREADLRAVLKNFEKNTQVRISPQQEARKIETRIESLDQIEEIDSALQRKDHVAEMEGIKRILVANEVRWQRAEVEYLGTAYLDLIAVDKIRDENYNGAKMGDTLYLRGWILAELRSGLSGQTLWGRLFGHELRNAALFSGSLVVVGYLFSVALFVPYRYPENYFFYTINRYFGTGLSLGVMGFVSAWTLQLLSPIRRVKRRASALFRNRYTQRVVRS